jgi:predicted dinucleotide-binding enzyme
MTTLGIIGAGNIGSQVARAAIAHGYDVIVANSRGPETLADLVAELGPHARAAAAAEAAAAADVALVSVPFKAYVDVPVAPLAGKIIMDTTNYYWERDGRIDALDRGEATTSGLLQAHLSRSKVVKAFNHIPWAEIMTASTPTGTPDRRAITVSSDYPDAREWVVRFYDELGFDAVDASPLAESWRAERDRPAYIGAQDAAELRANLAIAPRTI